MLWEFDFVNDEGTCSLDFSLIRRLFLYVTNLEISRELGISSIGYMVCERPREPTRHEADVSLSLMDNFIAADS